MHDNKAVLQQFYTAFQQRDYTTMQNCYADNAMFSDEVFVNLNASEVRAMWEMLCKNGKDLQLEFSNIQASEKSGSAEWIATYTFSKTGRKVVNRIKAEFVFADGKIISHIDRFSFYKWSSQALGLSGKLLGWTSLLRKKVRKSARQSLGDFIQRMPA